MSRSMSGELHEAVATVRRVARVVEPSCLAIEDAVALLEDVLEGEKLLGGLKTRLVKRLEECRAGARDGHASTAEWLAKKSGTSVGKARDGVDTASRLDQCPATHADISPLLGGEMEPGDTCEIPGVGTVSLSAARALLGDAILEVVLSDGVAVRTVVHPNRTVASVIKTALLWQHRECCVAGCHNVYGLETHHTEDYAKTRHTKLDELTLPCPPHHHLVTHERYTLRRRPDGQYDLIPPDRTGDTRDQRGPPRPMRNRAA